MCAPGASCDRLRPCYGAKSLVNRYPLTLLQTENESHPTLARARVRVRAQACACGRAQARVRVCVRVRERVRAHNGMGLGMGFITHFWDGVDILVCAIAH